MIGRLPSNENEQGFAMALVVLVVAVLSLFAVTLIAVVSSETDRSARSVWRDSAFQAAEAGIDDYTAKLVDDHLYFDHYVHPGESTRESSGSLLTPAGQAWTGGLTWTYPNGKDAWRPLGNGYEYNLQIASPNAGSPAVRIISTGRRAGSTTEQGAVETLIRPSSVADFFMITNSDYTAGSGATTNGKIYAGIDSSGNAHDITHNGTAYADLQAEGSERGSPTMMNGAKKYDSSNIRSAVKNPISFNNFLNSFGDVSRAAQNGGIYLNNPSVNGYRLTFRADGTVLVQTCTRSGGQNLAAVAPNCASGTSYNVPSNGAIYVEQPAIVSGIVNGRVTVVSNADIVVGDDISYVADGDDVLGLIAKNDVIVAEWCPTDLNWRAAVIAENGRRRSWSSDGSHGTATFKGSVASNQSPYMDMFRTRVYNYDDTLQYLPPPWYPIVEDAYTVLLFRELGA